MEDAPEPQSVERQHSRSRWVLIGFLAVAAFFLFSEHRAHFLGILPYLLLLACPLMHLLHHGHHRKNRGVNTNPETRDRRDTSAKPGDKS